ncbi:hypothetical protein RRG08_007646 [Elysia crispata]|uniref:Uncharacterized protein n=1 Tax=Elysia crispata TaxID=231223 RepID=A0AAE0Y365_9GAST|nr:hypothetical protein RRG08_007646 [Elysia crispata]
MGTAVKSYLTGSHCRASLSSQRRVLDTQQPLPLGDASTSRLSHATIARGERGGVGMHAWNKRHSAHLALDKPLSEEGRKKHLRLTSGHLSAPRPFPGLVQEMGSVTRDGRSMNVRSSQLQAAGLSLSDPSTSDRPAANLLGGSSR